jgi:4-oxalocrotonate tautomerase
MPNLNLYLLAGYPAEVKRILQRRVTEVVAETLVAPPTNVRLFLIELDPALISVAGISLDSPGVDARRLAGPTVQAFLISGRSDAQKEALIQRLSAVLCEVLDIPVDPIRIMIVDVPSGQFGFNGQTARAQGR